jgi:threonine dehydrogenase-like Zn-dependent dehydrogenase
VRSIDEGLGDDDVVIEVEAAQGTAAIGRVSEAGPRAATLLGQQVLVGPIDPCGECEVCRRGGGAVCPLARRRDEIGDRVIAAGRWVVPLANGLELPLPGGAAVAGDVALAYTLYARTGLGPRDPVVVVGASPVARFLVEILIAKGIAPTVVADPAHVAWCDWLQARGATIARATDDTRSAVAAAIATHGTGVKPWRVIATSPDAIDQAARLVGPRATLTILAAGPATGSGSGPGLLELASREVTMIGVAGAHPDLVVEAAAMCVKREIDLVGGTSTTSNDLMQAIVRAR